jgi:hypothetical protein
MFKTAAADMTMPATAAGGGIVLSLVLVLPAPLLLLALGTKLTLPGKGTTLLMP